VWAADDFARFFDQSLDLLCVAGFDGKFKYLNPAWTAALGRSLEELTSVPFFEFVHPDDRAATRAEMSTLGQGVETICFENRYLHRNGKYRWLQWNARQSPDRKLIFATARDVTPQKLLEQEIIGVADRERERIGREVHDGVCQTLAGIAALSTKLSRGLAANADPAAAATAAEITRLLNTSIQAARDLARGLSSLGINEVGLGGVLRTLALNVQHMFGVACGLVLDPTSVGIHSEAEGQLFRIAQEAVNNAVTHGRAARIDIRLATRNGKGVLTIEDDGVGLPKGARRSGGIGLHTMEYRARLIGASFKLQRRPGGGTKVTCAFPLSATAHTRGNLERGRDHA
jgi:PAS domain S-box-containing protein